MAVRELYDLRACAYIPPALHAALQRYSKDNKISMSTALRLFITRNLSTAGYLDRADLENMAALGLSRRMSA